MGIEPRGKAVNLGVVKLRAQFVAQVMATQEFVIGGREFVNGSAITRLIERTRNMIVDGTEELAVALLRNPGERRQRNLEQAGPRIRPATASHARKQV